MTAEVKELNFRETKDTQDARYDNEFNKIVKHQPLKESEIPIDILYNNEINKVKNKEKILGQKSKIITFSIGEDNHSDLQGSVRFEIEGGGKAIETNFYRKNEEEFFTFLKDFNEQNGRVSEANFCFSQTYIN